MKTELGKIVIGIDQKIYFEYYKLKKPIFEAHQKDVAYFQKNVERYKAPNMMLEMDRYKASKQQIEVSNFWREFPSGIRMIIKKGMVHIKDNQRCKAEVNGTAKIIELIK